MMAFRAMVAIGTVLLAHACYSAWEHSMLPASSLPSARSNSVELQELPIDVSIEVIFSVILICLGLVWGAEELKPISWSVWAKEVERDTGAAGPFQGLETRINFVDIRAKRQEFARWVRDGAQAQGKSP